MVRRRSDGMDEATAFALDCAKLWREVFGARLGCDHLHPKLNQKKEGNFANLKRGVLAAAGVVVKHSRLTPEERSKTSAESVVPGIPLKEVHVREGSASLGNETNKHWNQKFSKFQKKQTSRINKSCCAMRDADGP